MSGCCGLVVKQVDKLVHRTVVDWWWKKSRIRTYIQAHIKCCMCGR